MSFTRTKFGMGKMSRENADFLLMRENLDIEEAHKVYLFLGMPYLIARMGNVKKTQVYDMVATLGWNREKPGFRAETLAIRKRVRVLKYLHRKWGWKPGDEEVPVNRKASLTPVHPINGQHWDGQQWAVVGIPSANLCGFMALHGARMIRTSYGTLDIRIAMRKKTPNTIFAVPA